MKTFRQATFVAERAVYYHQAFPDLAMDVEPIENMINLKLGNKFIIIRASDGDLTGDLLKSYIYEAQRIFSNREIREIIQTNPTKLDISAKQGLGNLDVNAIKNIINRHMGAFIKGRKNRIVEVEVFLPDDRSIILAYDVNASPGLLGRIGKLLGRS